MDKTQKAAIYGIYLAAFMLLIPLGDLLETKINPFLLKAIIYPLVILMILPVWFLTRKKSEVDMDERDKAIIKKACILAAGIVSAGLLALYTFFIFMSPPDNGITPFMLQDIVFFSFLVFILVLSLAVLFQYGRICKGEKS